MRFRSSIVAMMSPPVKAVREPYLWLCPVDTPEVAHKMKAIVTAYNLPFLFFCTFYRTRCGLRKRKRNHSRGMETRHLTNNHGANLLHRLDMQGQEKHIRFSWNSRQSAFPPSVVLRRKQKPGQIVCVLILDSCISTLQPYRGGGERMPVSAVGTGYHDGCVTSFCENSTTLWIARTTNPGSSCMIQ